MATDRAVTPAVAGGSGAMFDQIAARYDLLNRWTSLGLDRRWRHKLVQALAPAEFARGSAVLDVATGTADVALAVLRAAPHVRVVGVDPSAEMLALGQKKWAKVAPPGATARLALILGEAARLPEVAGGWAGATMAFGIRNVPDRPRALAELRRVLRPGAPLVLLELTEPASGPLSWPARVWVHGVVPRLGAWISGASAYAYLAESIAAFPPGAQFAEQLRVAGFEDVRAVRLSFGAAHLFVGWAPRHAAR